MGILHNKIHSLYLLSTYSFQMSAWYQIFDIGRHTVHGNDEKSRILIITKNQDDAMKEAGHFKVHHPRAKWDFFKIDRSSTEQDNVKFLKKKINEFRPTNLILDFDHENKPVTFYTEKGAAKSFLVRKELALGYLTKALLIEKVFSGTTSQSLQKQGFQIGRSADTYLKCVHDHSDEISSHFMFLHLRDVWSDKTHGAVLMSSLPTTGRGWKLELEKIWETKTAISRTRPFKILVLSGTHGGKNPDGSWNTARSGFTNKNCLHPAFYQEDLKTALDLETEFKKVNPDLTIEVIDISGFNKQICAEKNHREELVNFVDEKEPDLLIIAWCYSTNGGVCMALRSNAILSRMIVEAEMRNIGIKDAKIDSDQVEVLKKAQNPKIKDIILTGGTGSGKTIIGAEVVKIWMAQHHTSVRTQYFIQRSYSLRRPQNLKKSSTEKFDITE